MNEEIGFFIYRKADIVIKRTVIKMKNSINGAKARLLVLISRQEMDFIDGISKDAMFSTGRKLSRTDVVAAILDAAASLAITGKNIHSKEELREYILEAKTKKIEDA